MAYLQQTKYLGFLISDSLQDNEDISRQMRILYARANSFMRDFNCCSVDIKLRLFQTYCSCFYGPHLWTNYTLKVFNKLKVAYNNVYRRLLGFSRSDSASFMFVHNNVPNFECLLRKCIYNFTKRIEQSSNDLIMLLRSNSRVRTGPMWSRWTKVLYTC